jgi:hypothetical protein
MSEVDYISKCYWLNCRRKYTGPGHRTRVWVLTRVFNCYHSLWVGEGEQVINCVFIRINPLCIQTLQSTVYSYASVHCVFIRISPLYSYASVHCVFIHFSPLCIHTHQSTVYSYASVPCVFIRISPLCIHTLQSTVYSYSSVHCIHIHQSTVYSYTVIWLSRDVRALHSLTTMRV